MRASPSFSSRNWQVTTGLLSAFVSTAPKYSWLARFTTVRSGWPLAARFSALATRSPQKS